MFKTKEDFRDFLRIKYYNPENIVEDSVLENRQKNILEAWDKQLNENPDSDMAKIYTDSFKKNKKNELNLENPSFNEVVEIHFKDICEALPKEISEIIQEKIVVTSVDTKFINAAVHISPCKKYYGIIINSSLIQLLHKMGKIIRAQENPESVIYCNRCDVKEITKEMLKEMYLEYFNYFKATKRSHGPIVQLKQEESIQHILNLRITELFLICHELGHVINGDFNDFKLGDSFFHNVDEANHRKEHMADITGFLLMLLTLEKKSGYDKNFRLSILFNIIYLIDLLYSLNDTETDSHPHPIRRAYCIIDQFYGPEWTELIEKSYSNTNILQQIKSDSPEIDSIEKEITEILFKWIDLTWKNQKPSA